MAEPEAAPPKGEAAPAPAAKAAEPAAEARKPKTAPAGPGFGGRILPYVLVWIAVTYGRDMLAGPQQVEKAPENAPSAARAPPVHHRDAADEEFAEFADVPAAPAAATPVEAASAPVAPAEAKPVEAVPAVTGSAASATAVLVRLCTSWGTQRNYLQLRQFLEDAYPQITTIDAEQYPPPPVGLFAQQIAGMAQIATLALMIGGEGVFRLFGAPTPAWYGGFKENKMFAFGCVWMANNVAAGMVATGAFEIVVGDRTIYSKLETGRLPNAKDVVDGLRRVGLTTPLEAKYLGTAPRSEL